MFALTLQGHFLVQMIVLLFQVGIMLIIAVFAFRVSIEGNAFFAFTILLLLGTVGMCFGLVVSSISPGEAEAVQAVLAVFFPSVLLSGVLWPVEAIPVWFSWVSKALPTTWAAAAMRAIMIRGWSMMHQEVWAAYLVCLGWALLFLILASLAISSREIQFRCCKKKKCCC